MLVSYIVFSNLTLSIRGCILSGNLKINAFYLRSDSLSSISVYLKPYPIDFKL